MYYNIEQSIIFLSLAIFADVPSVVLIIFNNWFVFPWFLLAFFLFSCFGCCSSCFWLFLYLGSSNFLFLIEVSCLCQTWLSLILCDWFRCQPLLFLSFLSTFGVHFLFWKVFGYLFGLKIINIKCELDGISCRPWSQVVLTSFKSKSPCINVRGR